MKTITRTLSGLVLSAVLLPAIASAYYTTDQSAVRFSETSALYSITYKFGSPSRDIYMPIVAERDTATYESSLVYEMLLDGKTYTDAGTAVGIVTSNAKIVDGQYFIPAGHSKTFTLKVVFTTPADIDEADYTVHVTRLPFLMVTEDDTELESELTDSELSYYQTPEIELNEPYEKTSSLVVESNVHTIILGNPTTTEEPVVEAVTETELNVAPATTYNADPSKFYFAN